MTTSILAPGNVAAATVDITVAAGEQVTVGLYSAAAAALPLGVWFAVEQITPGVPNYVGKLDDSVRSVSLGGPCTYRVRRPDYVGPAFGVFRSAEA